MSLIELIVYIGLLSTFVSGAVFSAYTMYISASIERDKIERDSSGGFVAIFSAISISLGLLLAAVGISSNVSGIYDEVMRTEYRLAAKSRAYACLSVAHMKISQDYFYIPPEGGDFVSEFECSILSVSSADSGNSNHRAVLARAVYAGIQASVQAVIELNTHTVRILHHNFTLF